MKISCLFILPELILIGGGLLILLGGVLGAGRRALGLAGFLTTMIAFYFLPGTLNLAPPVFSGMLVNDGLGFWMKGFILLVAALTVLMSLGFRWSDDDDAGEYYFFILAAVASLMLAVSAGNLMMIYLAVETLSVISYILAGFLKRDFHSTEAGLKYFLFGALSTGLMLYGISLVYGLCGTLDLGGVGAKLAAGIGQEPLIILAAVLIFAGFAFKASIVPFHMWVADVYEGAPWPVAAFFSIAPKALGFVLLAKIFLGGMLFWHPSWGAVAIVLSIFTMTVGNLSAFHQQSVKRLLAFSSVAQAGYILAGLAVGIIGLKAAFFYIFVYALMNMGAFSSAAFLSPDRSDLDAYRGLGRSAPRSALAFSVFLLSLAGLPPLAGFFAKFFVIWAAMETRHYLLAAVVVVNSVIAFFYYLKVIRTMYFEDPLPGRQVRISKSGRLLTAICLAGVLILGFWPGPVMDILAVVFI